MNSYLEREKCCIQIGLNREQAFREVERVVPYPGPYTSQGLCTMLRWELEASWWRRWWGTKPTTAHVSQGLPPATQEGTSVTAHSNDIFAWTVSSLALQITETKRVHKVMILLHLSALKVNTSRYKSFPYILAFFSLYCTMRLIFLFINISSYSTN